MCDNTSFPLDIRVCISECAFKFRKWAKSQITGGKITSKTYINYCRNWYESFKLTFFYLFSQGLTL